VPPTISPKTKTKTPNDPVPSGKNNHSRTLEMNHMQKTNVFWKNKCFLEASQAWWCTSIIPTLERPRKEDFEFEARLGQSKFQAASSYLERCYLNKQKKYFVETTSRALAYDRGQ
jgi:hypothetical protein